MNHPFDLFLRIAPEVMHLLFQGIAKHLFKRCFNAKNVPSMPGRNPTLGIRLPPSVLTPGLEGIRCPSEFDRRARSLEEGNFADYKASG